MGCWGKGFYFLKAYASHQKIPHNLAKNRFNRKLIPVEGGTYMLLSRAMEKVHLGLARIINGRVRFMNPTDAGYERAPGFVRWGGSISYDPDTGEAPQVMQAHRTNKGRRGAA